MNGSRFRVSLFTSRAFGEQANESFSFHSRQHSLEIALAEIISIDDRRKHSNNRLNQWVAAHETFARDEMNTIEYTKGHSEYWGIPITAMTRYSDVLSVLVDVLPASYPDSEKHLECQETQYHDNSIQPVLNPDPQPS